MKEAEIGVQSYTYRKFDMAGIVKELAGTGITALEIWPRHLNCKSAAEQVEEARRMLADAGIRVCGMGVTSFSSEKPEEIRPALAFAAELGADYMSIDVKPDDERCKQMLVEAAGEIGILLAIHNHGPTHHYATAESVLAACERYDEVLGACVDTGHFQRAGQSGEHAIRVLGRRVHAVHLKDFIDAETEVVPGKGQLNYATTLAALEEHTAFHNALVIEYEANAEDPTPSMRETVAVLKEALEAKG